MFKHHFATSLLLECCLVAVTYAAISVVPTNQYVNVGGNVNLTCTSDKATSWSFDPVSGTTTSITSTSSTDRVYIDNTDGKLNLVITNAATSDAGVYRCVDSDGSKGAYLAVFSPVPSNTAQVNSGQEYISGDSVTTTCSAGYTAKAEMSVSLAVSSGETTSSSAGTISLTGLSFTIQNNEISQYCEFYFTVPYPSSLELDGSDTPRKKVSPTGISVSFCAETPTVTPTVPHPKEVITCSSAGFPAPTYKWSDNNNNQIGASSSITVPDGVSSLKCEATNTLTRLTCTTQSTTVNVEVLTTAAPVVVVTSSNPSPPATTTTNSAKTTEAQKEFGEVPTYVTAAVGGFGGVLVIVIIIQFIQSAPAASAMAIGNMALAMQIHNMRQMQQIRRVPQNMRQFRPPRKTPRRLRRF